MQNYVTWVGIPVEGGIQHPNTHDQDKASTGGAIDFTEYGYQVDGENIAIISYDENVVSQTDLITFANVKPGFQLKVVSEEQVNLMLSEIGDISVKDFVFTDNRPTGDEFLFENK